jgi:alpha-beta hydrolase superfamily lysophospholipase
MTTREEGFFDAPDGLRLFWRCERPEAPRALLLFVHGLGEHAGRYQFPFDYFALRGLACYAFDYRGHGRSPGPRVHVSSFAEFLGDLRAARAMVLRQHPPLPLFLVGHSQGGLLALRHALDHPEGLAGVVASSPPLAAHPDSAPSPALQAAARVLSALLPWLRLPNGVDPAYVSRDASVVAAYRADPLVSRKVSARWFTSLQETMRKTLDDAVMLRVPALVMSGAADRLTDPEAARRFAHAAPPGLVTYQRWDGLYHELFNEPEREQVFARMEDWIGMRLAEGPSQPG